MSNFADKKLLYILSEKNLINRNFQNFNGRVLLGEISLSAHSYIRVFYENFPSVLNLPSKELIILSFYHKEFIGEFSFFAQRNPFDCQPDLYFDEARFMDDFSSPNGYLTKSASIERLMLYSEFKEWLIWNRI